MLDEKYRVVCIDVHADWCGPCTVMQFFFDKLVLDVERCDERVAWYSVSQELLPESIKGLLPTWSKVNIYSKGCCPLFLFVLWNQVGALRCTHFTCVAFAPIHHFMSRAHHHHMKRPGHQETGAMEMVAEVEGCDSPQVIKELREYMPPVPETPRSP